MNNLFSSFDPSAWFSLNMNWCSMFIMFMTFPSALWLSHSQGMTFFSLVVNYLVKEFSTILNPKSSPGILIISLGLFFFILMNNFFGLFPYIFTASSHLTFSVSLALPLWVGHMLLAIVKTPQSVLAHLVPLGTPVMLMPLMVLIEMISSIIRPLTLSVRLAANMIAGHLLLTLLANHSANIEISIFLIILSLLLLLGILESAVSVIQTYVFSVLSTLYFNEVNSPNL